MAAIAGPRRRCAGAGILLALTVATSPSLRVCNVQPGTLAPPKRPPTSYLLFFADSRQSVRDSLPDKVPITEVMKEVGRRWQSLNNDEKEKYVSAAKSAKAAYQKAVKDFMAAGGVMPGAKPPRDPNIPKKPPSAMGLFMSEKRLDIMESLAPGDNFLVEAGRRWRDLGDDARAPYQAKAEQLKAAYAKKRKAYLDSGGVIPVKKPKLRTRGKKKMKRDPREPKRPLSAYMLWTRENRPTIAASLPAGHRPSEVMKEAGQRWRALGEKQKAPYQQKAADLKAEYQKEMRKYEDFLRGS